jgi:hypothetical protein
MNFSIHDLTAEAEELCTRCEKFGKVEVKLAYIQDPNAPGRLESYIPPSYCLVDGQWVAFYLDIGCNGCMESPFITLKRPIALRFRMSGVA